MAITRFKYNGESWTRIDHQPYEAYIVGVDPGFTVDPTGICVLHHRRVPLADDFVVNHDKRTTEQKVQERYEVVHIERLPLGTEYPEVVAHIEAMLGRAPLCHINPDLVIDATGIGISVAQLLERAGLKPIKVTITASTTEQVRIKLRDWHVGKALLVASLDGGLHTGEVKFAPLLLEASAVKEELADFNRLVGAAGRATYAARTGAHDDLVLSACLTTWWAKERRKHQTFINGKSPAEMEQHLRRFGRSVPRHGQSAPNVSIRPITEADLHEHKVMLDKPLFAAGGKKR